MPAEGDYDRYRAYWDAIRARVCAVCLDAADDGSCRLVRGHACAIVEQLPRLIEVLRGVRSQRMDEYVNAVETQICSHCASRAQDGDCKLRHSGNCALYTYLPLILDAIDEVDRKGAA